MKLRAIMATALIAAAVIATPMSAEAGRRSRTVTVREGESIQEAIDAAVGKTKIIVRGHHAENVWIDKSRIELVGRDGASLTLPAEPVPNPCQGQDPETGETFDTLVCVFPASGEFPAPPGDELHDVSVSGLALQGSTSDSIAAFFTEDLEIEKNTIVDPGCDGIFVLFADDFEIERNTVSNSANCVGIRAAASTDGEVSKNTSTGNAFAGIEINDSTNIDVERNTASDNCIGFVVTDTPDPSGLPTVDVDVTRNVANGNNTVCYPFDPPGSQTIPIGAAGILVAGATDTKVERNTASDNVTAEFTLTAAGIIVTDFPGDDPAVPFAVSQNTAVKRNTSQGNSSVEGPLDLRLTTAGSLGSVKKNTCDVSLPDPGWCGGVPLAAHFAEGGVMAGSTNGISFAPDGTLWVANVLGATITQIHPDSGEILSRLTAADGVLFPDDVVVDDAYNIYWTDIGLGTVFKRLPDGTTFPLVLPIPGGLNSANPLTLNDDGSRLWAAGCYGAPPANNSFVELDPTGADPANGIINVLRENIPGCASNGMSFNGGFLYAPQPFTNEILRLDPALDVDQVPVPVTTNWPVPIGTAFDSTGNLYSLAQGVGEVVRIDLTNANTDENRTVIAEIPVGWADNIAISDDDRIFVSSASDSAIWEVTGGTIRVVVPGQFELPMGVAVIDDTVYTANIGGVWGFDRSTGDPTSVFRAAFGLTEFPSTTSVVSWDDQLVVMSALDGHIALWDPTTNQPTAQGQLFPPTDAQPFRGDLIVTQGNGEIVRLDADLVPIEVVANVPGATGLARRGSSVYVADSINGTVLQIMKHGRALATPVVVVDGLSAPEGIDIAGNKLYVVEGGTQTLTRVSLSSGKRTTIATGLGLQDPTPLSATGWFNDVTVAGDDIYVNADRANAIYEFDR